MMKLTLYNSLTREKQEFKPMNPKRVTMYNCGPTVYSYAHIGNARAAVVADVLFRVLRYIYGENHVVYARNLTDVDDKIIAAAQELGVPMSELTEKFARIYNEDLSALNCLSPTYQPKATDNINEMEDIIVELLEKSVAYISGTDVFFDVTKKEDYGKLSGRNVDDDKARARVKSSAEKRNPEDFLLWKYIPGEDESFSYAAPKIQTFADKNWRKFFNEPKILSPGRPGWHIECSAMIKSTLGKTIDIHCGGIDLKFPHHENEIAQSECANGKPLANYWVHNEFLNMGKDKMSKSLGNVVLVHDLLKDWDGEVIRHALLGALHRNELVWGEQRLHLSQGKLDELYRKLAFLPKVQPKLSRRYKNIFIDSFLNDLDYASVLTGIEEMLFACVNGRWNHGRMKLYFGGNSNVSIELKNELAFYIRECVDLLGILQKDPEDWFRGKGKEGGLSDEAIDNLIAERAEVRAAKDWTRADEIRDIFAAENIILEDSKDGTTWRRG